MPHVALTEGHTLGFPWRNCRPFLLACFLWWPYGCCLCPKKNACLCCSCPYSPARCDVGYNLIVIKCQALWPLWWRWSGCLQTAGQWWEHSHCTARQVLGEVWAQWGVGPVPSAYGISYISFPRLIDNSWQEWPSNANTSALCSVTGLWPQLQ